jgi:hypothetical protein
MSLRNILLPSSGLKSKPRKQAVDFPLLDLPLDNEDWGARGSVVG